MKSIRTKISITLIICTLLSTIICGTISIINTSKSEISNANSQMRLTCQNQSSQLETILSRISDSVNVLANISLSYLKDVDTFKNSREYVDSYTSELKPIFKQFAINTNGAYTAYIRFNPDFTYPTSGIFLAKDKTTGAFLFSTPTDFSMYDKTDTEHVGWYYAPIENMKPMWMEPYMNNELATYLISYVVPLFINGEPIGIVGMDVDFHQLTEIVSQATVFHTGYAFLSSQNEQILFHKDLKNGTSIETASPSLHKKLQDTLSENFDNTKTISYTYNKQKKSLYSVPLSNGMYYSLTAPKQELQETSKTMTYLIFGGSALAVLIAVIIGLFSGTAIAKPISMLERIIVMTADFNFAKTKDGKKLQQSKDETGKMAISIHKMRKALRKMVADIQEAQKNLSHTVVDLVSSSNEITRMSEDNSATTEELSAAMQETAATMQSIESTVENIQRDSSQIQSDCNAGMTLAQEVKKRANHLKEDTLNGSKTTKNMYDDLRAKTDTAIEQAKTVEQINQLANIILDISEQTNLLALNASIEAARAGEAGKGFHVVAQEIGTLANQTASTTEMIKKTIDDVHEVVAHMSQCLIESTDFLNHNVLSDYEKFIKTSESYADDAHNYEDRMDSIQVSIHSLSNAITEIAEAINGVNITIDETTTGITEIAEKTQDTTALVESNHNFIRINEEQIQKLQKIIEMFHIDAVEPNDSNNHPEQ